jgi:hypothetical protein
MAWYAGPELLGLAELPAWPSMFVMPCPPPLTPPSQGGERARSHCHSITRAKNTRLETIPRARSTVSFHHRDRPPFARGGNSSRNRGLCRVPCPAQPGKGLFVIAS